MLDAEIPQGIDGLPASAWAARQGIANQDHWQDGVHLGVYTTPIVRPDFTLTVNLRAIKISLGAFTDPEISGEISYKISDYQGKEAASGRTSITNGKGYLSLPLWSWSPGAYKIEAVGTLDGSPVRANNTFLVSDLPLNTGQDGIGMVVTARDGRFITEPLTSPDGVFLFNENGAAIFQPANLDPMPTIITITLPGYLPRQVTLPLPFTRIIQTSLSQRVSGSSSYLPLVAYSIQRPFEWPTPSGGNLVLNPSFEYGGATPESWEPGCTGGVLPSWDVSDARSGTHSICLSNFPEYRSASWNTKDLIPVSPNTIYKVRLSVKGSAYSTQPYIDIATYGEDRAPLSGMLSFLSYSASEWTTHTTRFISTDARTRYIQINLGINALWSDPGELCFDDVYFGR